MAAHFVSYPKAKHRGDAALCCHWLPALGCPWLWRRKLWGGRLPWAGGASERRPGPGALRGPGHPELVGGHHWELQVFFPVRGGAELLVSFCHKGGGSDASFVEALFQASLGGVQKAGWCRLFAQDAVQRALQQEGLHAVGLPGDETPYQKNRKSPMQTPARRECNTTLPIWSNGSET